MLCKLDNSHVSVSVFSNREVCDGSLLHPLLAEENKQKSCGEGYNQGVHTPMKQIDCERHKEETLCTINCKHSLPAAMIKSSVTKGF